MERITAEDVRSILTKLFQWQGLKWAVAAGIALVANFVAQAPVVWRGLLVALTVFFLLDIPTGVAVSLRLKRMHLSSYLLGRSLLKFSCYLVVLLLAITIDRLVGCAYSLSLVVLSLAVAREGLSVLENTRALWEAAGLDWPFGFLGEKLEQITRSPGKKGD